MSGKIVLSKRIWFTVAAGAAIAIVTATVLLWPKRTTLPQLGEMPDFHLKDQAERVVTGHSLHGKVQVVSFVFTNCGDICPTITAQMRDLQQRLKSAGLLGSKVELTSISVDPERDTPTALKQYAAKFEADTTSWRFLTGSPAEIEATVVQGFKLSAYKSQGNGPYLVVHSDRIVLVDNTGYIRAYYPVTEWNADHVIADIKSLY